MQRFVQITNRKDGKAYTSQRKALLYVSRGFAAVVAATDTGQITQIRMLEAAELAITKSLLRQIRVTDPVTGKFEWFVGDSGGSRLMKQYEGVSGGHRVFQASHGN